MAKKKEQTPEDIAKNVQLNLDSQKRDLLKIVAKGFIPEPTRTFEVGEEVEFGSHEHVVVVEKTEDNLMYLVHSKYTSTKTGAFAPQEKNHDSKYWVFWVDVFKKRKPESFAALPQFTVRDDMRLQFFQSQLSSFNSSFYHFGVDINPEYQRELVWQLEDKQKLIDSIFKNVDIGKFVFIRRSYNESENPTPHLMEVLDGKQRLTAIKEFWEDRFQYNGFYYSQLHPRDQSHFDGYLISMAEVSDPTKEQIYRYFLRLNTAGKPIAQSHLDKVAGLLHGEIQKREA